MNEFTIVMLGPTGVGKTSLLTAIYEQFESSIGATDLQLIPDDESSAILQERLIELKSVLNNFGTEITGGIKGTAGDPDNLRSFTFSLGRKGKSPSLQLHFRDYPGGYLSPKEDPEKKKFLKTLLTNSVAVLIAIDAPALMEANGRWHQLINRPQQIRDIFKSTYLDLCSPRLVIFAPMKCEKYMQNENLSLKLVRRIKEEYQLLFDLFQSKAVSQNIVSVITPVQTLGSVQFSRIEMKDNFPSFKFSAINPNPQYCPKDSEQPLRYLLRFLLKLHLVNHRNWGMLNFIRDMFGMDTHLVHAIEEFSKGCKSTGSFVVVQGDSWLKL